MIETIHNKKINLCGISPFSTDAKFIDMSSPITINQPDSHTHSECEIYVNITGDVSFMVENNIYPIMSGDVIITRPYEYHHCIYHSNAPHKHFWILFSCDGNEKLLDTFFNRKAGENNLIRLSKENSSIFKKLCTSLVCDDLSSTEELALFFRIISLLDGGEKIEMKEDSKKLPGDLLFAIDYINNNLQSNINIKDLARLCFVSINTLERHFSEFLQMSPCVFIRKKRLSHAVNLLKSGKSVSEACFESGFCDYSHFISLFKSSFGVTPLQYKKQMNTHSY